MCGSSSLGVHLELVHSLDFQQQLHDLPAAEGGCDVDRTIAVFVLRSWRRALPQQFLHQTTVTTSISRVEVVSASPSCEEGDGEGPVARGSCAFMGSLEPGGPCRVFAAASTSRWLPRAPPGRYGP